jgi:hypothetical protein
MRCPCSLCECLDHFTYQCPMIIEYRQCQLTLIQTPAESTVDLTSSLEIIHIISPKPEALPTPLWFLDDLSKDSPPILPFISLQNVYIQIQLVLLSTSIFGLCRVNHRNLLASFPLLLHHQGIATQ